MGSLSASDVNEMAMIGVAARAAKGLVGTSSSVQRRVTLNLVKEVKAARNYGPKSNSHRKTCRVIRVTRKAFELGPRRGTIRVFGPFGKRFLTGNDFLISSSLQLSTSLTLNSGFATGQLDLFGIVPGVSPLSWVFLVEIVWRSATVDPLRDIAKTLRFEIPAHHRKGALFMIGIAFSAWIVCSIAQRFEYDPNPPLRRVLGREGVPEWDQNSEMPHDVFTFVRLRYTSTHNHFRTHWSGDFPSADLNFSYRLQQLTSMKVAPEGLVLDITDERLHGYPFTFMSSPGKMLLSEEEVKSLRRYLRAGGFLMVDDFWGREYLENVMAELDRVLPGVKPVDLPLTHPIFHMVYSLDRKPQVPSINAWNQGLEIEPWHGDMTDPDPHFLAYHDEKGRIMVLLCHNNDLADGWEREGENVEYFKRFSERWCYPMGINIVVYALTH